VLSLFEFTLPGRLPKGGPVFLSAFVTTGRRALTRAALACVLCGSAIWGPFFPVVAAQSSTAPAPSHPVAKKKKPAAPKSRRQLAPDPARIEEIQQALAREGFYEGEPTGKWDDSTVEAMKNFQQARGLQPTGKIEALSLQKLGLGSSIAGLARPAPQSPATAPPPYTPGAPQKP